MKQKITNRTFAVLTIGGIILYIILYIIATLAYPGGSDIKRNSVGFDWQHNYWCELLAPIAQNGKHNTARPIAICAMYVLAISLIVFWFFIPRLFGKINFSGLMIRYCGIASMLVLPFLLTGDHDLVMNIGGLLGCTALTVLLIKLFVNHLHALGFLGVFCLILCGINNYVYYTEHYIYFLPIIQKFSFVVFLLWFILLSIKFSESSRRKFSTNL